MPDDEYQDFLPSLTSLPLEIIEIQEKQPLKLSNILSSDRLPWDVIHSLLRRWPTSSFHISSLYLRCCLLNERLIVEKFFDTILQQRVAISEATDLLPLKQPWLFCWPMSVEETIRRSTRSTRTSEAKR